MECYDTSWSMKSEKIIYCVYFDKNFLLKGLALYESMIKFNPEINLWILALDGYTERILKKMKLKGTTVVPLRLFEDKELLAVKKTRSAVEYYWTCSPSWLLYILKKNRNIDYVVYLDADLYFFANPDNGLDEIGKRSLLAVEHRFPKGRENMIKDDGRFNVAFNVFRNNKTGIRCLKRWRNQCLDWCYWKSEDGKLGDQMYLDEWPTLYERELVIAKNKGLDAAPWNISPYKISSKREGVYIDHERLICYHFHQFTILGPNNFSRVYVYPLSKNVVEYIYRPYEDKIRRLYKMVKRIDPEFKMKVSVPKNIELMKYRLARLIGPIYWRLRSFLSN
jgi:hypothetical protein